MHQHFEENSSRSSCSATYVGLSPIMDYHSSNPIKWRHSKTQETSTSTDLKVSLQPRSFGGLILSPDAKDPFPSCRLPARMHRKPVFNIFDSARKGGLSNAHSTMDIVCSMKIEEPVLQNNAVSLNAITLIDRVKNPTANFRRGKPVQRAASRLYKADCGFKKEGCVGPEFIIRASQPVKKMDLTLSANADKRVVTVVLLNGQKVDVTCDPNMITASQLFEALVHSEKYEHSFMLGVAILICGDFVFLPDDYKIKKIAPENWYKIGSKKKTIEEPILFTLFIRIKFFLPKNISTNIQGGEWRYRVYLQLRRATIEGSLTSTIQNLILLAGYALHIEFGEFSYREHGSADYFLMEHYLPETVITSNMADVKLRMKCAHESRYGLDRNTAIINYITLSQTFRDYGAHFYSAIWATRDGFCRDVWLSIGPRGITIYSRNNQMTEDSSTCPNRIVLQSLPWHHIHTFYHNKKSLYILPNSYSGLSKIGVKYKLKMADNKSYFTFWLASLHHRLYLKLYAKVDFINYLSDELSCPVNSVISPAKIECSNYQDSYNLAVRNPLRTRRQVRRRFTVDIFSDKSAQNKENEKADTEELLRQILLPQNDDIVTGSNKNKGNSSSEGLSSSESSLPRRQGVKMGTRVFNGMISPPLHSKYTSPLLKSSPNIFFNTERDLVYNQSDSDDLCSEQRQHCSVNSMKLLPERYYTEKTSNAPTAYVLESPKVYQEVLNYATSNDSCLNTSLFEKLDNMECVQGERLFVTAVLERDHTNALGLQVAEGSDGNVYIKAITTGSPADSSHKLLPGDQIISVNGKTLLNVQYDKALCLLQAAPQTVELIVLQNCNNTSIDPEGSNNPRNAITTCIASALDGELTDDELLNEEALKTIYALIKLTKEKVINRIKDKSRKQTTPNRSNLQKSVSENNVYGETDFGNYSSEENTPQKRNAQKFNTWRGQFNLKSGKLKRRPLSLSIPADKELSENYLDENTEDLLKWTSLKSIQSSLNSIDKSVKSSSSKNVALPRNYGFSRKWLGPVRYPVTPCKNNVVTDGSAIPDGNVLRRHFIYGAGDSDEDQIFL
ncbi:Tyrosine-protein phosphatase [Operophtera brumata]|uniref:Tyrosine-protein phosphatase n=1 Tax=Operophtera brumata TaxID=104452 RepID=A0A0L7KYK2_OPEBR|nr:Tyrosine-protein phosphatase [Operophtera brumata]